jgi:hypothetical protein
MNMYNPNFVNQCKQFVRREAEHKNILVNYVRDKKKRPRTVVVAINTDSGIRYGVASCNKNLDTYNKYVGTYIAAQRALKNKPIEASSKTLRAVDKMQERANSYWKTNYWQLNGVAYQNLVVNS